MWAHPENTRKQITWKRSSTETIQELKNRNTWESIAEEIKKAMNVWGVTDEQCRKQSEK